MRAFNKFVSSKNLSDMSYKSAHVWTTLDKSICNKQIQRRVTNHDSYLDF